MSGSLLKTPARLLAIGLLIGLMQCVPSPCRILGGSQDDVAQSVVRAFTPENGYVLCGWTKSYPSAQSNKNVLVVRLGKNGQPDMAVVTLGPRDEAATSITRTADQCYAVTGWTLSDNADDSPRSDIFLLKLDANLRMRWGRVYHLADPDLDHGGCSVIEVSPARGGGYAIAANAMISGEYRALVLRVDGNGGFLWDRYYWLPGYHWHNGLGITEVSDPAAPNVCFALVGNCSVPPTSANADAFAMRLTDRGIPQGVDVLSGRESEVACSVVWDEGPKMAGIVAAGWTRSFGTNTPSSNIWVTKIRAVDGSILWSNAYSFEPSADRDELVFSDKALTGLKLNGLGSGYAITGATYSQWPSTPVAPNVVVMRVNPDGTLGWNGNATIHPSATENNAEDRGFALTETEGIPELPSPGAGYAVVGLTYSFAPPPSLGGSNIHFVTFDQNGKRRECAFQKALSVAAMKWEQVVPAFDSIAVSITGIKTAECKLESQTECGSR